MSNLTPLPRLWSEDPLGAAGPTHTTAQPVGDGIYVRSIDPFTKTDQLEISGFRKGQKDNSGRDIITGTIKRSVDWVNPSDKSVARCHVIVSIVCPKEYDPPIIDESTQMDRAESVRHMIKDINDLGEQGLLTKILAGSK